MQPAAIFLPFNPKSDWLLISPSSITVDSNIKVMRIRKWSPTREAFDFEEALLPQEIQREQYEYAYWYQGVNC